MDWTYSMFSWFGYFMPFEERIQLIADAGFDEVMISWEDEAAPYELKKEKFPDIVRSHGLGITNFHGPYMGYSVIWEKSPRENRELLNSLISMVEDCRRFDVPALVVHTCDLDMQADFHYDYGLAFFSELAEAGERCGVDIAVENVSRTFLLRYLLDRIQTPHFGMCYDVSHDYMLGCGRGRLLDEYGDRLKALHFSDNDLNLDRHWIPGDGWIPEEHVIAQLKKIGWSTLSFEVCAPWWRQKGDPAEFVRDLRHSTGPFIARAEGKKFIEVTAAVIRDDDGKILIGKRGEGGSCAHLWEFPGGKIEKGERPVDCLIRECHEELSCDISCGDAPMYETTYEYPDVCVHLRFFKAGIEEGEPAANVHDALKWVSPEELTEYQFCPADEEFIEDLSRRKYDK